jgi:hypothetical protein
MQTDFSLTTRRVAEVAGVERCAILTAFQRHGHWKTVVPRRQGNGRLLWPAVAVYQALGKLPPNGRQTPIDTARDRACRQTGVDPYQAHLIVSHELSERVFGATPRERLDDLKASLDELRHRIKAAGRRIGYALGDEQATTPADWADFNSFARDLASDVESAVQPLLWRTA